jgi:cytoskeleton protein RodZ
MAFPYDFSKVKENGVFPDMANFGASFKKARESKGISLDQIALETRISTRFLSAIENEEFQLLPGGIFNRGFVRTFAEKIGLDPEQAVADYERLAEVRQPIEVPPVPTVPQEKPARHLYPLAIAGLILVIVIFYLVTKESSNTAQTAGGPTAVPPPAVVPSPPPSPPSATLPSPLPVAPPSPPPATPPDTTAAAPEPELAPQTEPLRIDLDVKETTWIKVAADGVTVNPGEILEPGMTRHYSAKKSILLVIGNAAGLDLKINDMPGKSLGKGGQVRELTITPDNIKNFVK